MRTRTSGNLRVDVASGDAFEVRDFSVREALNALFQVTVTARCRNANVDFEAAVGAEARFTVTMRSGTERRWSGICNELQQVGADDDGVSTYRISIVPRLWLATQRRNHRVFQQLSEPAIALELLEDWKLEPKLQLDLAAYKSRRYRVQYGESDFDFLCRLLEDAGVSFYFEPTSGESALVLTDAPQNATTRQPALPFYDNPSLSKGDFVTSLTVGRRVRPGRYTMRDHDYRRPPDFQLEATAQASGEGGSTAVEAELERYHYVPGAFLFGTSEGEATPAADDKGKVRALQSEGASLAQKRLDAKRGSATRVAFATSAHDVAPGVVVELLDHPRADLGSGKSLLVLESTLFGSHDREWVQNCEAQSTELAYRPALETSKPVALGTESATVVGPAGEEIHCDEFGRVRVHFHWDRGSRMDDSSSCWIHVAQPWSGAGYGAICLPRVGQEALVQFLGGDPDRPVIVGRVFTNLQKVPYKLPDHKTRSGLRSASTHGTGGFNEIMFEDEAGEELFNVQAERDFQMLVKHDATSTVASELSVTVGKSLTKRVSENEREFTGMNRTVTVGVDRSTRVEANDTTSVGASYTLLISKDGSGDGAGEGTTVAVSERTIVLSTGEGARIILEGNKVRIQGETIELEGSSSVTSKPMVVPG